MIADLRLESYLNAVDKALGDTPISQRAEIITEVKKQISLAQDKDPSATTDQILGSLGQPESLANQFLRERGLRSVPLPSKPSRGPIIKWLVIGFLGTAGIFTLFVTVLIFKFLPLIEVSEKGGHIKVFGGTIDFNDFDKDGFSTWNKKGMFKLGRYHSIEGARLVDPRVVDKIFIPFSNGEFEITYNHLKKFSWDCKAAEGSDAFSMATEQDRILTLNLKKTKGVKCELSLPAETLVVISGTNGGLEIENPQGPVDIQLENGSVVVEPDLRKAYNFEIKVLNGNADSFDSTNATNAIKIKIDIKNGYVQKG
ncbi:MAG: hypothetical protein A4S09_05440 [Proteobacteria bacterium SG_bin7]|nr:MAG: hypothetical protein A4S09_05440 [Proteobacteria bacterium SG_bin7]